MSNVKHYVQKRGPNVLKLLENGDLTFIGKVFSKNRISIREMLLGTKGSDANMLKVYQYAMKMIEDRNKKRLESVKKAKNNFQQFLKTQQASSA